MPDDAEGPPPTPTDLHYALVGARARGARPKTTLRMAPPLRTVERRQVTEDAVALDEESRDGGDGIVVGLVDSPRQRRQFLLRIDLRGGGLLIEGSIGSGKTTAAATCAWAFLSAKGSVVPGIVAIDGGGGALLQALARDRSTPAVAGPLATSAEVVASSDIAAVTLAIDRIAYVLERRKAGLADPWQVDGEEAVPILFMLDNVGSVLAPMGRYRAGHWYERLLSLVVEGRTFGISTVITAARRQDVPSELRDSMRHVVTLGSATEDAAADLAEEEPGRGRTRFGDELQFFVTDTTTPCDSNGDVFAFFKPLEPRIRAARPHDVHVEDDKMTLMIGLDEVSRAPVSVSIGNRHLLVVGPQLSGKSNVLTLLAQGISQSVDGRRVVAIAPRRSLIDDSCELIDLSEFHSLEASHPGRDLDSDRARVDEFLRNHQQNATIGDRLIILVDDGHFLAKEPFAQYWLERAAEQQHVALVVSSDVGAATYGGWDFVKDNGRQVLFLRPRITDEQDDGTRVIADALRQRPLARYTDGRGILYDQGTQRVIQTFDVTNT